MIRTGAGTFKPLTSSVMRFTDSGLAISDMHNMRSSPVNKTKSPAPPLFWYLPMMEFLLQPIPQVVIWSTVLVIVILTSIYVVKKYRDQIDEDMPGPIEHMSFFREIYDEGDITETEFRTIKTVLSEQLEGASNEPDETD